MREVRDGHDGTWVAHPGLVPLAKEIFDAHMPSANQIARQRDDVYAGASDLLAVPQGTRTEKGLRWNVRVGVQYLEAWLRGSGCVPLYDLLEDAATAEISRAQIAQWIRHEARLEDGRPVTRGLLATIVGEEIGAVKREAGDLAGRRFDDAADLFEQVAAGDPFVSFLTLPAYDVLTREA